MTPRRPSRRALYPNRFLGRRLEAAANERIQSEQYRSEAAVARALGYDRSRFNSWITGNAHPRDEEDWQKLTELGIDRDELRYLEKLDKLDAWRQELGLATEELVGLSHDLDEKT